MYGGVHMGNICDVQLKQASELAKLNLAEYIIFKEKIFRLQRCATYRTNSNANKHFLLTKMNPPISRGTSKYYANEPASRFNPNLA